jgi:dTDP-4-dehydrorhamnose 3,5-epimerase
MKIVQSHLAGALIIEPEVFGDQRGFFMESWNLERYRACGLAASFVQDNLSFSRRGILRGLHYQKPAPQGKLVSVLQGEVFDVAVDVRRRSPTFGQWHGVNLSADNKRQFYVPVGFAHGFVVLSDMALVHYKCTEYYAPGNERAIRWDDPDLKIEWPIQAPTLSAKDAKAPLFKDIPVEQLFDEASS